MSYCRCGPDSDVYMYGSFHGQFAVHLKSGETYILNSSKEALMCLQDLKRSGVKVPASAINRLKKEIKLEKS